MINTNKGLTAGQSIHAVFFSIEHASNILIMKF